MNEMKNKLQQIKERLHIKNSSKNSEDDSMESNSIIDDSIDLSIENDNSNMDIEDEQLYEAEELIEVEFYFDKNKLLDKSLTIYDLQSLNRNKTSLIYYKDQIQLNFRLKTKQQK